MTEHQSPSPVMRGCLYGGGITAVAALLILLLLTLTGCAPATPTHICQRWDLSDTRLAAQDRDGFTYRDGNGIKRQITASESDQWRCEPLDEPATP